MRPSLKMMMKPSYISLALAMVIVTQLIVTRLVAKTDGVETSMGRRNVNGFAWSNSGLLVWQKQAPQRLYEHLNTFLLPAEQ
jgi:hypothetical protein